jgi:C1A family cysteine protease
VDNLKRRRFITYPSPYNSKDYTYSQAPYKWQESVDLREWDSAVESQYELGSCVGNAIANAYEHMLQRHQPRNFVELSRLFIYYNARLKTNEELVDAGTTVKAGLQGLKTYGVCKESLWPYNIEMFDDRPSNEAYTDAASRKITSYTRLFTNSNTIDALRYGNPVVFGLEIFDRFMDLTLDNAVVSSPKNAEKSVGGHAMCLVGYDLRTKMFLAKNSFGTDWGNNGYCWIPFDYFENYSYDKWVFTINSQNSS